MRRTNIQIYAYSCMYYSSVYEYCYGIYMLHVDIDAFLYSTYLQVSGTNLLRLPARDAYSYALSLVDIIFTKEELSSSLLFKSAKSEKPGLPKLGVDKLFGKWRSKGSVPASLKEVCNVAWSCSSHYSFFVLCSLLLPIACIEKRYGKSYEIRTLTSKVNQKCRDTARPQKPPKDLCDPLWLSTVILNYIISVVCTLFILTWSLEWPYLNYQDHAWNTQAFAWNIPDLAWNIPDLAWNIPDRAWIIQDLTWIIQDLPWIIQDLSWFFQDHVWSCQDLFQNPTWTIQDHDKIPAMILLHPCHDLVKILPYISGREADRKSTTGWPHSP